jgi:two-component sensor histidine kinase
MSSMDQQQLDSVKKQVKADEALTKSTERLQLLATVKRLLQRARAEHKAGGC